MTRPKAAICAIRGRKRSMRPPRCEMTTRQLSASGGRGPTRRAHRQAHRQGRALLTPRRRAADRRRPGRSRRHDRAESGDQRRRRQPHHRGWRALACAGASRLWRYHKPPGLITSHRDPQGRPTVFEKVTTQLGYVVSVGRLDFNSEGLLLLTNDGALARELEHPSRGWRRRYRVRVRGIPEERALAALGQGITVEGVRYGPIEAHLDRQNRRMPLTLALAEGRYRRDPHRARASRLSVNASSARPTGAFPGRLRGAKISPKSRRVCFARLGNNGASVRCGFVLAWRGPAGLRPRRHAYAARPEERVREAMSTFCSTAGWRDPRRRPL